MRSSSFKKSLAATAVLATSVVTGVGLASSAQASTPGPSSSPLTITNGTGTILFNGQAHQYQGTIGQASWAPDGSRIAFIDNAGNVYTERAGGSTPTVVAPAKAGATRSTPTWVDGGRAIVFSETVNGVSKLQAVPVYTAPGNQVEQTDPLSALSTKFTEGGDSAPDSNGRTLAFQHHNYGDRQGRDLGPGQLRPRQRRPDPADRRRRLADRLARRQDHRLPAQGRGGPTSRSGPSPGTARTRRPRPARRSSSPPTPTTTCTRRSPPTARASPTRAGPAQGRRRDRGGLGRRRPAAGARGVDHGGVPAYQPPNSNTMARLPAATGSAPRSPPRGRCGPPPATLPTPSC